MADPFGGSGNNNRQQSADPFGGSGNNNRQQSADPFGGSGNNNRQQSADPFGGSGNNNRQQSADPFGGSGNNNRQQSADPFGGSGNNNRQQSADPFGGSGNNNRQQSADPFGGSGNNNRQQSADPFGGSGNNNRQQSADPFGGSGNNNRQQSADPFGGSGNNNRQQSADPFGGSGNNNRQQSADPFGGSGNNNRQQSADPFGGSGNNNRQQSADPFGGSGNNNRQQSADPFGGSGNNNRQQSADPFDGSGNNNRQQSADPFGGSGNNNRQQSADPFGGSGNNNRQQSADPFGGSGNNNRPQQNDPFNSNRNDHRGNDRFNSNDRNDRYSNDRRDDRFNDNRNNRDTDRFNNRDNNNRSDHFSNNSNRDDRFQQTRNFSSEPPQKRTFDSSFFDNKPTNSRQKQPRPTPNFDTYSTLKPAENDQPTTALNTTYNITYLSPLPQIPPMLNFTDLIPFPIQFSTPSSVQKFGIPLALSGRDLVGIASTGSGKTLVFALTMCFLIQNAPTTNSPICVVMAPTRELALQIAAETKKIGENFAKKPQVACFVGGERYVQHDQIDVLIATPGRLFDVFQRGDVNFDQTQMLVLDEADLMLEQGFQRQIKFVFEGVQKPTQTLMFSATWPESVRDLAATFMNQETMCFLRVDDEIPTVNADVKQKVFLVGRREKPARLRQLVKENPGKSILVFVNSKRTIEYLSEYESISGDLVQAQRNKIAQDFKNKRFDVLISTNLLSRGFDLEELDIVVNYDMPPDIFQYVHRCGRTGRAGKKGIAVSFFDENFDSAISLEIFQAVDQSGGEMDEGFKGVIGRMMGMV